MTGKERAEALARLGALCLEAVRVCGDNPGSAEAFVGKAIERLPPADRARIETCLRRIEAWHKPDSTDTVH